MTLCNLAVTVVQSGLPRGSGPHPIRPSATFPSKAGEGEPRPSPRMDCVYAPMSFASRCSANA